MTNNFIISRRKLTSSGFYGFHKNVVELASGIEDNLFKELLNEYIVSVEKFGDYISSISELESKKNAHVILMERDQTFRNFRGYVKSLRYVLDDNLKNFGNEIWKVIENVDRNGRTGKDTLTTLVERSLCRVNELVSSEPYSSIYSGSELEKWVVKLQEVHDRFLKASKVCLEERQNRETDSNMELRRVCMDSFYMLRNYAEIQSRKEDGKRYSEFVRQLELLGDSRRQTYSTSKKKQSDSSENKGGSSDVA